MKDVTKKPVDIVNFSINHYQLKNPQANFIMTGWDDEPYVPKPAKKRSLIKRILSFLIYGIDWGLVLIIGCLALYFIGQYFCIKYTGSAADVGTPIFIK